MSLPDFSTDESFEDYADDLYAYAEANDDEDLLAILDAFQSDDATEEGSK